MPTIADIDSLDDFTPEHLLKATKNTIVNVLLAGQAYGINGRSYTRANLPELKKLRDDLSREIAEAANGGLLIAYGDFNEPI